MTFNRRQKSPLGAFVRSPLGAHGQEGGAGLLNGNGVCFEAGLVGGAQPRWFDQGIGGNDDCATGFGGGLSAYRITLDCEGVNLSPGPGAYPDPADGVRIRITGQTSGDVIDVGLWRDTWAGFGGCLYRSAFPFHDAWYSQEIQSIYRQYNVFAQEKNVQKQPGDPLTKGLSIGIVCHEIPIWPRPAPGRPPAFGPPGELLTVTYVR